MAAFAVELHFIFYSVFPWCIGIGNCIYKKYNRNRKDLFFKPGWLWCWCFDGGCSRMDFFSRIASPGGRIHGHHGKFIFIAKKEPMVDHCAWFGNCSFYFLP